MRKLDPTEVALILELLRQGKTEQEIAEMFGVSRQAINDVARGRTHKGAIR